MSAARAQSPYLSALGAIPRGETRSYTELAAAAGRPGAARAAGRALGRPEAESLVWHRVVAADGRPRGEASKVELQWKRLRREGARPRRGESVPDWAKRVGARFVGSFATGEYLKATADRLAEWDPERVEPFRNEAGAKSRGFRPYGAPRPTSEPLPEPRPRKGSGGPERPSLAERLARVDVTRHLLSRGWSRLAGLLSPEECARILAESIAPPRFERSVDMAPRGYGVGSYYYYRDPLPEPAESLRALLYPLLLPAARRGWPRESFPDALDRFRAECREAGQRRASSILICYGEGGINHLHRDIYGRRWFPFQALVMLSRRGRDFEGGEFLLTADGDPPEESVVPVTEGDVVVFATRERLEEERQRKRPVRHGMRLLRRGKRYGLGLVFHLAE